MNKRSASKCLCEIYGLKTNKKKELLVFTSKTFICFFMLPKCLSLPLSPTPPRQKSLITLVFSFNFLKTLQKLYTKTLNSAFSTVPKYADLALYSLSWRTFAEPAQNLTLEKSWGGCKVQHILVTNLCGDHVWLCLTWLSRMSALALCHWLSLEVNQKSVAITMI